jgi:HAD domain in Swiss Army Knife RNA repair proteins
MKVIFLDVDGVLNTYESGFGGFMPGGAEEYTTEQLLWDYNCVKRLRRIVEATDAKIVVSSFWRKDFPAVHEFPKFFTTYAWSSAPVIGQTPDFDDGSKHTGPYGTRFASAVARADEVYDYLSRHSEITHYVILDDMSPENFSFNLDWNPAWLVVKDHYLQTDDTLGITDENVETAIALLGGPVNG